MDKSFEAEHGNVRLYWSPWYNQWAVCVDGGWAVEIFDSFRKAANKYEALTGVWLGQK